MTNEDFWKKLTAAEDAAIACAAVEADVRTLTCRFVAAFKGKDHPHWRPAQFLVSSAAYALYIEKNLDKARKLAGDGLMLLERELEYEPQLPSLPSEAMTADKLLFGVGTIVGVTELRVDSGAVDVTGDMMIAAGVERIIFRVRTSKFRVLSELGDGTIIFAVWEKSLILHHIHVVQY